MSSTRRRARRGARAEIIDEADASLLEVIDQLLNQGVVLTGDLMLGIADVDLVYVRLAALLCAADRGPGARSPRHDRVLPDAREK